MTSFVTLTSPATSIVLEEAGPGPPIWRYWGPALPLGVEPPSSATVARLPGTFALEDEAHFSLFPTLGDAGFFPPAVLMHRDGLDWAPRWTETKTNALSSSELVLEFLDDVAGVEARLSLQLDPLTDCLVSQTELVNHGGASVDVLWIAACNLLLPKQCDHVSYWTGRHTNEFQLQQLPLGAGGFRRENRQGLTSHNAMPTIFVPTKNGSVYAAHFAWSGNAVTDIQPLPDGRYALQMGEWRTPGECHLEPGESIETPAVIATCGHNGAAASEQLRRAMRQKTTWPGGAPSRRPVQLNTWEAVYFAQDEAAMIDLANSAAALGVERFVLDDGWFKGRRNDQTSLGDWEPDPQKYPNGLAPLADHVVGLGMQFGLWVEPEMISPQSDLARAHPEWVRATPGRARITGRHQCVVDLTQAAAQVHLFTVLADLLASLPISYLKWDHNRALTADLPQATYGDHTRALYSLLSRLREAFPTVEIESCAAGGGRIDAGILQYTHRFWVSDNLDAVSRLGMQREFLKIFPPEVMGSHVGAAPAHTTGRSQSLPFRCAVAATGHFGVELDPRTLSGGDHKTLRAWIDFYKAYRQIIHGERVVLGPEEDGVAWQAHGSDDSWLLFVYRTQLHAERYPAPVPLPFVQESASYTVERVDPAQGRFRHASSFWPPDDARRIHGAWLRHDGVPLPLMTAEDVAIFVLTPNDKP